MRAKNSQVIVGLPEGFYNFPHIVQLTRSESGTNMEAY